jgi:hypothetical protein
MYLSYLSSRCTGSQGMCGSRRTAEHQGFRLVTTRVQNQRPSTTARTSCAARMSCSPDAGRWLADPAGRDGQGSWTSERGVLKVRGAENLNELDEVMSVRHTVVRQGIGGWQMPATAQIGDLAIWYSRNPHQKFVAYGWVSGVPYTNPRASGSSTKARSAGLRRCPVAPSLGRRLAPGLGSWPTPTR